MLIVERRKVGALAAALAIPAALALASSVWDRVVEPKVQPTINSPGPDASATLATGVRRPSDLVSISRCRLSIYSRIPMNQATRLMVRKSEIGYSSTRVRGPAATFAYVSSRRRAAHSKWDSVRGTPSGAFVSGRRVAMAGHQRWCFANAAVGPEDRPAPCSSLRSMLAIRPSLIVKRCQTWLSERTLPWRSLTSW